MGRFTRPVRVGASLVTVALMAAACSSGRVTSSGGGASSGTTVPGGVDLDISKCTNYQPTQGISADTITFGSSFPQSGLYAAYAKIAKGYEAYFKFVNANGGVKGKKIKMITKDDQYDSGKTKANIAQLTQADGVFGMFSVVGTPNNLAIRDDLGAACIPDLFVATGSQFWGNASQYPWLIGSFPAYSTEAAIFAEYLKTNKPNAKVAILQQNDDFGQNYVDAFKKAIQGTSITIVDNEKYNATDPDVKSQVTTMAQSGADTALVAATALKCPQALNSIKESSWKPLTYISDTCTSNTIVGLAKNANQDVLSSIYLKDPVDPEWANDPAMKEFQTVGAQNGLTADDLKDGIVAYGWTMGALLAETLKAAPQLTRQAVMQAAYGLQNVKPGLVLPGISVNTNGTKDPFPIEQMQIGKYNGSFWALQGSIINFEGKSADYGSVK